MNSDIQPGDIVHDLTQNARMQVLEKVADSVAEHRESEGFDLSTYKSHPLLRVSDDDAVFKCVFLPGELGAPSGSYDFPESRLARIPIEEANAEAERPQETIRLELAIELMREAWESDDNADVVALLKELLEGVEFGLGVDAREIVLAENLEATGGEE